MRRQIRGVEEMEEVVIVMAWGLGGFGRPGRELVLAERADERVEKRGRRVGKGMMDDGRWLMDDS